jgi:hypothetical protein
LNLLDASEVPDCDCEVAAEKGSDQFQSGSKLFVIMVAPSPSFDAIVSTTFMLGETIEEGEEEDAHCTGHEKAGCEMNLYHGGISGGWSPGCSRKQDG